MRDHILCLFLRLLDRPAHERLILLPIGNYLLLSLLVFARDRWDLIRIPLWGPQKGLLHLAMQKLDDIVLPQCFHSYHIVSHRLFRGCMAKFNFLTHFWQRHTNHDRQLADSHRVLRKSLLKT